MAEPDAATAVTVCGHGAKAAAPALAAAPDEAVNAALHGMAKLLGDAEAVLLDANSADVAAGEAAGLGRGLLDRLTLGETRIAEMARQISLLASAPFPPAHRRLRDLGDGFFLAERRIPVGVIGANYEARPNVTIDVASQLLKSRNAGVLRTGAAALRSATALFDHVVSPALEHAGLDPGALQLVRSAERQAAMELVARPGLIPLVILRGSGDTTRALAAEAARHGVRTLAHADGGGVLYLDAAADPVLAAELIGASLDRLGVCNRLNLLLVHAGVWDQMLAVAEPALRGRGVAMSLPPHDHPLGHEWALDTGHEATVTVAPVDGPAQAAAVANSQTSGLAASVVTTDPAAARAFLGAYAGTGAFWNASTRLLDGFKLRGVPETGINVDHVPGPRGPVTFEDLCLRQYVVTPADGTAGPPEAPPPAPPPS